MSATNCLSSPTTKLPNVVDDFILKKDDFDLDSPTQGFDSVSDAIKHIRLGKMVIVVDDEGEKNEGYLVMAAKLVTDEATKFMVNHGNGIVYVSLKEEDFVRFQLPITETTNDNVKESLAATFAVSVDAKDGVTGVPAQDRAKTILTLASRDSKAEDLNHKGNIYPLRYKAGGVLTRAAHKEASMDLVVLAGLDPVAVLSRIVGEANDGCATRLSKLRELAQADNLKIISIADLIGYKRKREKIFELVTVARLPTSWGQFKAYCYKSLIDGIEHIAMVKGDVGDGDDILVRVHSECLTGDIFRSARCDCGDQLSLAMEKIEKDGKGVVVYLRGHEGRGIGLGPKLCAYNLQDAGFDTVEANVELGLPIDSRDYTIAAQILQDLGVHKIKLMTNNPAKSIGLRGFGLTVVGRVPLLTPVTVDNKKYLDTKRTKMGHIYNSEVDSDVSENGEVNSYLNGNDKVNGGVEGQVDSNVFENGKVNDYVNGNDKINGGVEGHGNGEF